jgi:hypothetical protein
VVTKQHHDDKIVDNNHQVLVFKTIFRIRELPVLVFWGNNPHQRTTSSSYFKTLKEPTAL